MTQNGSKPCAGSAISLRPEQVSWLLSGFRHDLLGAIQPLILDVDSLLEPSGNPAQNLSSRLEPRIRGQFERLEDEIRALVWLADWLGGGKTRLESTGLQELLRGLRQARDVKARASAASIFARAAHSARLALFPRVLPSERTVVLRLRAAPGGRTAPAPVVGCLLGSISPEQALEAGCSARLAGLAWVLGRTLESSGFLLVPGRRAASVVISRSSN